MGYHKFFWSIGKILTQFLYNFTKKLNQVSTRREINSSIKTLKISEVYMGLDNYKNLPKTEYRRILEIYNSILNPKTGILWLNKKLIKESSYWNICDLTKWEPFPYFPRKISGSYSFLPDNGYFHFLVEDLPRFIEAHCFSKNLTSIAGSKARYVTQALDILNKNNYVIYDVPVKVDKVVMSEKINGVIFSKHDLELLKSAFSPYIKTHATESTFISRKDTSGDKFNSRGIDQKKNIEEIFKNEGFNIVYLEELNFVDQIALLSRSTRIAGFHGAGLANIIWANSASVIEISKTQKTRHFEHLSKICSHKYSFFSTLQSIHDLQKVIS